MINLLMSKFQPFPGWSQAEVSFLFSFGLLSEAIFVIFFSSAYVISEYVTNGEFDRLLTKPLGVYLQCSFRKFNYVGLSEVFSSAVIFVLSLGKVGLTLSGTLVCKITVFTLAATVLRYSFFTITNSLAFWTKKTTALHSVCCQITNEVTRYSITIFPHIVQKFFTILFPIAYISYYPTHDILGESFARILNIDSTILLVIIALVLLVVSIKVFNYGLKKYESAGS